LKYSKGALEPATTRYAKSTAELAASLASRLCGLLAINEISTEALKNGVSPEQILGHNSQATGLRSFQMAA